LKELKKIIFIVPYFGKLPNYFSLWLKSCEFNQSIDWVLFIDDEQQFNYPKNVKVSYCQFDDIKQIFQQKIGDDIELKTPYQLCEFRISFGYVFDNLIKGYDFWGYCDVDVLWGNLRKFFTDDVLENYDKIGWRGHLTLFKNNKEINSIFKRTVNGIDWWAIASKNATNFPLAFDEGGISYYFEENDKHTFYDFPFADLKIRSFNFECMHVFDDNSKDIPTVYHWEGDLLRYSVRDGKLECHEFAYIHFLKRPIKISSDFFVRANNNISEPFWIVPNQFLPKEKLTLDINCITKYGKRRIYWSYYLNRLNIKYLKSKLRYKKSKIEFKKTHGWFNFESPNYSFKLRKV
jgi:hypothetical protein